MWVIGVDLHRQLRIDLHADLSSHSADRFPAILRIRTQRIASHESDLFVPQFLEMIQREDRCPLVIQNNVGDAFQLSCGRQSQQWAA